MAVADAEEELASTLRWGVSLTGTYLARVFVWGLVFVALSAPSLHLTPIVYSASTPFLWLAIVGVVIGMLRPNLREEDAELLDRWVTSYQEKNRREKFIYFVTFATLGISAISFEVAFVGVAATVIAEQFSLGLLAVVIALWVPAADPWLGRTVGWNIASTGGLIGLLIMEVVAVLYQVSPEVPRSAATEMRGSLLVR